MRQRRNRPRANNPGRDNRATGLWSNNFAAVNVAAGATTGNILQEDSIAFILQEDSASKITTEA